MEALEVEQVNRQVHGSQMKLIALRLFEEGIITASEHNELLKKSTQAQQELELFSYMKSFDWRSSIRVLQLLKYVSSGEKIQFVKETNPLMIDAVVKHLFGYMDYDSLKNCHSVCKKWNFIADRPFKERSRIRFPRYDYCSIHREIVGVEDFVKVFGRPYSTDFMASSVAIEEYTYPMAHFITLLKIYGRYINELNLSMLFLEDQLKRHVPFFDLTPSLKRCPIRKMHLNCFNSATQMEMTLNVFDPDKLIGLYLNTCSINIQGVPKIKPIEILLNNINISVNQERSSEFLINSAIDFSRATDVEIICDDSKTMIKLDVAAVENTKIKMNSLDLDSVIVVNWGTSDWDVAELRLRSMSISDKVTMKIRSCVISGLSIVNVSKLPPTIEALLLNDPNSAVYFTEYISWESLQYLTMYGSINLVSWFSPCPNLVDMELKGGNEEDTFLTTDDLPTSIRRIKLTGVEVDGHGAKYIEKLILDKYSFFDAATVTKLLKPNELVLRWYPGDTFEISDSVIKFIRSTFLHLLIVGPFTNKFENSQIARHVDFHSPYYKFVGSQGKSITRAEFDQYMIL